MKLKVLYEDNHLIAVWKPAGILAQGDRTGQVTLMDEVKNYLKKKYNKPGQVFLGLLHRLDRPVAGVILFAKTSKGAARLSEQIRERQVKKIYHALVEGQLERKQGVLAHYLVKDHGANRVSVFNTPVKDGQRAELAYESVANNEHQTLVKIQLKTGRPHQIRAQMAAIGHPIVGDKKYGARTPYEKEALALCATSLSFKTATGGEDKIVSVKPPLSLDR